MREKDKPLKVTNKISRRILSELIKRNGTDKLYDLCNHMNAHQGSIRRRLEAGERSWSVAEDILNISKYLNVDIEWLLTGKSKQSILKEEAHKWMTRAIECESKVKTLLKNNSKLKAALFLFQSMEKEKSKKP